MFNFFKKNLKLKYKSGVVLGLYSFHLIATLGGREIGKAYGDIEKSGKFRLVKIDVYSDYRSNGYGGMMIQRLVDAAREDKCTSFVFVGVSDSNNGAIKLYERLGAIREKKPNCDDKNDYIMALR